MTLTPIQTAALIAALLVTGLSAAIGWAWDRLRAHRRAGGAR